MVVFKNTDFSQNAKFLHPVPTEALERRTRNAHRFELGLAAHRPLKCSRTVTATDAETPAHVSLASC